MNVMPASMAACTSRVARARSSARRDASRRAPESRPGCRAAERACGHFNRSTSPCHLRSVLYALRSFLPSAYRCGKTNASRAAISETFAVTAASRPGLRPGQRRHDDTTTRRCCLSLHRRCKHDQRLKKDPRRNWRATRQLLVVAGAALRAGTGVRAGRSRATSAGVAGQWPALTPATPAPQGRRRRQRGKR